MCRFFGVVRDVVANVVNIVRPDYISTSMVIISSIAVFVFTNELSIYFGSVFCNVIACGRFYCWWWYG